MILLNLTWFLLGLCMRMMLRAAPSAMRRWGAWCRCQAVQRTVQNNGNLKSEPKYLAWARILNTCFLILIVLLLLSWFLWWADFVAFFLRVASCRLRLAFVLYADLAPQNTYAAQGQPCCPLLPWSPRNVIPTLWCNAYIWYPARMWAQIDIPSVTSNWHS